MLPQKLIRVPENKKREFGTTIKIYNPLNKNWDIFTDVVGEAVQLTANQENISIVPTCVYPVGFSMK